VLPFYILGDLTKITTRLATHIHERHVTGFDRDDFIEYFFNSPTFQRNQKFISLSRLDENFCPKLNSIIVFENGVLQPREVSGMRLVRVYNVFIQHMNCISTTDYLWLSNGYCEYVLRRILHYEGVTGKMCSVACVFSMQNVSAMDWKNPTAPWCKMVCPHLSCVLCKTDVQLLCRAESWQDNYPEIVSAIYVLHASAAVRAAIHLARIFLHARQIERLHLVNDPVADELRMLIGAEYLPPVYGGTLVDTSRGLTDPFTCMTNRVHMTKVCLLLTSADTRPCLHTYNTCLKKFL
jgi:hypothetical protein